MFDAPFAPARLPLAALAAVLVLGAAVPAMAQSRQPARVTVTPPSDAFMTPGSPLQDRGVPPSFQQYPLLQRIFGGGGAIFPNYVDPGDGRRQSWTGFVTGGGEGRMIFAAGTVDRLCQDGEVPRITPLDPLPPGVKLSFDLGPFIATGSDGRGNLCIGRQVRGTRVFSAGRPPHAGATVRLRVAYPRAASRTHVVTIPAR